MCCAVKLNQALTKRQPKALQPMIGFVFLVELGIVLFSCSRYIIFVFVLVLAIDQFRVRLLKVSPKTQKEFPNWCYMCRNKEHKFVENVEFYEPHGQTIVPSTDCRSIDGQLMVSSDSRYVSIFSKSISDRRSQLTDHR